MKRFIFSILCVSVFFTGLGGIANQIGARFKSDERALALIRQARIAIGGDASITNVRSLTAKGNAARTFNFDGANVSHAGDFEINLALPNQFSKMMKLRTENISGDGSKQMVNEERQIVMIKKADGDKTVFNSGKDGATKNKVVIVKNSDGEIETEDVRSAGDGNNRRVREMRVLKGEGENHHRNELLRTMLSLFLTAPEGVDVSYFYVGAGDVDGTACEIVEAKTGNDSVAKIYLSQSTKLPVMMSYQGTDLPRVIKINREDTKPGSGNKDVKVLVGEADAPPLAEINVKFSDYRTVGGLRLPFAWTQTADGKTAETVSIESYEINPANIAEKFNQMPPKVLIRTERKEQ
jgi:hypothetical protein